MIHPDNNLLMRYLNGTCTPQEERRVEEWLEKDPAHARRLEYVAGEGNEPADINTPKIKKHVMKKIGRKEAPLHSKRRTSTRQVRRWMAAAIILVVSLAGSATYYYANVASGDKKTAYIQKSMPAGEVATLTLSDGSTIQLNSGSTIRYPRQFSEDTRDVYLQGEAYFEVVRDTEHPFRVQTGSVTTTVLGTAFNVEAFGNDSQVRVAVSEGKVAVESNSVELSREEKPVILTANQWVSYDTTQKILEKRSGDISSMIAWKDGLLRFDDQSLSAVARQLERWYGVTIEIKNPQIAECIIINGRHKDEYLENVLKSIKFATGITYTMTEDKVIIEGGRCK